MYSTVVGFAHSGIIRKSHCSIIALVKSYGDELTFLFAQDHSPLLLYDLLQRIYLSLVLLAFANLGLVGQFRNN